MFGGSFWSSEMVHSMSSASAALDDLLEKGNFTLEQLLAQDDVIQECKAMNSVLVDYLCKPESILQMIKYITSVPEEKASDATKDKYPLVCSELFACELVSMFDALLDNHEAMAQLFGFVAGKEPLNSTLAGYFRKVVGVLIQRKYDELSNYIRQNPDVLVNLTNHLESTSIMEVIIMLGWDDGFYQHSNDVNWLLELKLIPQIVSKLAKEFDEDVHINASYTLVDVITKSPPNQDSPLMHHVQSPVILEQLLDHVFSDCDSSFVHGVRVVIALLQRAVQFEADFGHEDVQMPCHELNALVKKLPQLLELLNKAPANEILTSYGALRPPLGEVRLRAAELTCNLVQFDDEILQKRMGELRLIPKLLDLFFEFPWHNILHNLVESAIQIIFVAEEGKLTEFRRSMIHDGKLLERIMEAFNQNYENDKKGGFKLGNMAFVSRISLILVDRQERDSELRNLIGDNSSWKAFVENDIERERERLMAILMGHRNNIGGDEDIYEQSGEDLPSHSYGIVATSTTADVMLEYTEEEEDDDDAWQEESGDHPEEDDAEVDDFTSKKFGAFSTS